MKLPFLDGLINFMNKMNEEANSSNNLIKNLRQDLNNARSLNQTYENEIQSHRSHSLFMNRNKKKSKEIKEKEIKPMEIYEDPESKELLKKIAAFNHNYDFNGIYSLLNELAEKGNHKIMSVACRFGICKPRNQNQDVLCAACENGNLLLVKTLIECGCNIEGSKHLNPLIWASAKGKLEIVKYLIAAGANKNANCF